jgi:hypothetical protein
VGIFADGISVVPVRVGSVTGVTSIINFNPILNDDVVGVSSWVLKGKGSTTLCEAANFGTRSESLEGSVWTVEIDTNNEAGDQPLGSGSAGIGLAMGTGSTYSPDSAVWIYRTKGEGSGPGWNRGIWITGAKQVGIGIETQDDQKLVALYCTRTGDSSYRFKIDEDGTMTWTDGKGVLLNTLGPNTKQGFWSKLKSLFGG